MLLQVFILSGVLLMIRSQVYDDHDKRQILFPEGCPAPCFMGIRPGITGVEEAIHILKSSGWTANIQIQPTSRWVIVQWNQRAPAWLLPHDSSNNLALATRSSQVEEIHLPTSLDLSEVELLMGRSDSNEVTIFRGMGEGQFIPVLDYTAAYRRYSMLVALTQNCNGTAHVSHNSPDVVVRYYADMSVLDDLLKQFHDSWREVRRMKC